MKPEQWEKQFGTQYLITLENEMRPYFALEKVESWWDKQVYYSRTNLWWKRTTLFFDGDMIRKVIEEEKQVNADKEIRRQSYREYDTCLPTKERKLLFPLTKRGKPKPLTASAVANTIPSGCVFFLEMETGRDTILSVSNFRSNQRLPVGEMDKVAAIHNDSDFQRFASWYQATCPDDYFDKVERVKNSVKQTVKYRPGDLFRVEYDRFSYVYGLATARVQDILRWEELPDSHSFHMLMMTPVLVRFYEVITPNAFMAPEELSCYSLSRVEICDDHDLVWGTHPIVGHRMITEEDVEFPLVCSRVSGDFSPEGGDSDLYVEWGTAQAVLPGDSLSPQLQSWLKTYYCPWGGVHMGIFPDLIGRTEEEKLRLPGYRNNLQIPENQEIREELFACLGLPNAADFDDFAAAFDGLMLHEIVKKLHTNEKL